MSNNDKPSRRWKAKLALGVVAVITILYGLLILVHQPAVISWIVSPPPPIESVTMESFRFGNYWDPNTLDPVLKKLLPPGTPKAEIDSALVEKADAEMIDDTLTTDGTVVYLHRKNVMPNVTCFPMFWVVTVKYDAQRKLSSLWLAPSCRDSFLYVSAMSRRKHK